LVLHPVDPNAHYRARRRKARRRRRIRRAGVTVVLVLCAASVAYAARTITDRQSSSGPPERVKIVDQRPKAEKKFVPPDTIRGVHVTMALASIPGKIDEYLNLPGLNTIELDVKDENGEVGFVASSVPLAKQVGAAKPYYKPRLMAKKIHARGVYLIGRVVVMEDPVLSAQRPELAIRTTDGSRWLNHAGLGWVNPYDQRVWDYVVDIAESAARTGFDEIQFDYVRFPSDGDLSAIVYPEKTATPPGWVIAQFAQYAAKRLKPFGVRVSADVFGLSATRDLGIGQIPRRIGRYLDALYPMVYPSHYADGEYNLADPNANPGATVAYSLRDFNEQLAPTKAKIVPWLQDFTLNGPTYALPEIQAQIDSARRAKAGGYLLWNAAGVYTPGAVEASRWNP
jgi:hypothetical protein